MSASAVEIVLVRVFVSLCHLCDGQIQYKDSVGQGTAIPDLPEVKRVRDTQKNISSVEKDANSFRLV